MTTIDRLHYLKIPGGKGGRAEAVRMVYVLAQRPYEDAFVPMAEARTGVTGKNPFLQYPFVVTPQGRIVVQSLAIMHHAAHGTSAWPQEPDVLTDALSTAMGAYDLYQHFGGFPASDVEAKRRFETRRAPQFFGALAQVYAGRPFAAGETPTFADCLAAEAVGWCVRRNERCQELLSEHGSLQQFLTRFEALPAIAAFRTRQAKARELDDAV